jgi:nucleoside-diphosphate-sugar epimerase
VRDVADAHLKAAATPDAANKRYLLLADGPTITWLGLAEAVRDRLGAGGTKVTLKEAPGEDPAPLTIHNDRAKQELGWQPRAAHTTINDTVDSLQGLGLLDTGR